MDKHARREDHDETEKALRHTEQHLDLVLELADITAARVDTDLRHTWVHDAGPDQVAESTALGKRDDELFPPDVAEPTLELKRAVVESGEPMTRTVTFRKSDSDRTYRIRAEPMLDDDGDVEGVMQAAVDITESERQRQQLKVATRMLRHNLRNRVTTLLGQAELLDEQLATRPGGEQVPRLQTVLDALDDELRAADPTAVPTAEMERTLDEAKQLAADLSTFSEGDVAEISQTIRRVTGRLYELTEKVDRFLVVSDTHTYYDTSSGTDLAPTLEEVRDELTAAHPNANISVDSTVEQTVLAPSNELRIGVLEIAENAIVHNDRSEPTVELRAREHDSGRVSVEVRDDGPGIPDHEARVIEEITEAPLEHGSGIGLWLAQWVSNKHGGPLRVESVDDGGTVVSLTLATGDN